jgi:hypothetical protein
MEKSISTAWFRLKIPALKILAPRKDAGQLDDEEALDLVMIFSFRRIELRLTGCCQKQDAEYPQK